MSLPSLSWWLSQAPQFTNCKNPESSPGLSTVDCVIVGCGISGASAALEIRLQAPHLKVCVVEARCVSGGATGRNGGLIWPSLNASWNTTAAAYGEAGATEMLAFEEQAYKDVINFIKDNKLEEATAFSHFPDGGFTLFESQEQMSRELQDLRILSSKGADACHASLLSQKEMEDMHIYSPKEECHALSSVDPPASSNPAFVGGVLQRQVSRVTAALLTQCILRKAASITPSENLIVLQNTRVTAVQQYTALGTQLGVPGSAGTEGAAGRSEEREVEDGAGSGKGGEEENAVGRGAHLEPRLVVTLKSTSSSQELGGEGKGLDGALAEGEAVAGSRLVCGRILHCTNGYNTLLPQLRESGWILPVRNQVAVTKPLPENHPMPHAGFSARGNYVYFSRRLDNRIVLGGFRDVTPHMEWGTTDDSTSGLDPHVSDCLRSYLPEHFPHLFSLTEPGQGVGKGLSEVAGKGGSEANGEVLGKLEGAVIAQTSVGMPVKAQKTDEVGGVCIEAATPWHVEFEMEWAGILGFTPDRWPLVGSLPGSLSASGGCGFDVRGAHRNSGHLGASSRSSDSACCPSEETVTAASSGNGVNDEEMGTAACDGEADIVEAAASLQVTSAEQSYEFCCMGFTGHGMTRAFTCARNAARLMLGVPLEKGFPAAALDPKRCLTTPGTCKSKE